MYHVRQRHPDRGGEVRRGRNLPVRERVTNGQRTLLCLTRPDRSLAELRGPDGVKTVRVRFPSDDEWTERQRRRKVIVKQSRAAGCRKRRSRTARRSTPRCWRRSAPRRSREVDPFEAHEGRRAVAPGDVDDVVPAGDSFRVTTRVLGGTTTHLLKMPSAKDVIEYRRGFARVARPAVQPPGAHRQPAGRPATCTRSSCEATEGYVGDVPIIHQAVAVKAAIDALDTALPGGSGRKFLAGEWPEQPSLRYLIHWALRRDELCDPGLCPDAPEGGRCDHCPQDKLDAAQTSEPGMLIRRALDLRAALNLGIHIGSRRDPGGRVLRDADPRRRAGPVRSRADEHPWQTITSSNWSSKSMWTRRTRPSRASTRACPRIEQAAAKAARGASRGHRRLHRQCRQGRRGRHAAGGRVRKGRRLVREAGLEILEIRRAHGDDDRRHEPVGEGERLRGRRAGAAGRPAQGSGHLARRKRMASSSAWCSRSWICRRRPSWRASRRTPRSFPATNSSEALEKIILGITTGQTRLLHNMGLQVSLEQVVQQKERELGRDDLRSANVARRC